MTYDVVFSLEASSELVRIAGAVPPSALVIQAAESIRRKLQSDPQGIGSPLSEGLFYIDAESLRAFFVIDRDHMTVEITDFRVL